MVKQIHKISIVSEKKVFHLKEENLLRIIRKFSFRRITLVKPLKFSNISNDKIFNNRNLRENAIIYRYC